MSRMLDTFMRKIWWRIGLAFALVITSAALFVELADEVREQETLPIDESILRVINSISSPLLDGVMVVLTQLGGVWGVFVLSMTGIALLWRRRMYRMATLLAASVGGAALLNLLLKTFFQRARPALWERLVMEDSYSFPSGHAMASSALALSFIVICWPTRWRYVSIICAVLYIALIGFSRLYLGVHYPTDVLGGWIVSAGWVVAVVVALRYRTWSKGEANKLP